MIPLSNSRYSSSNSDFEGGYTIKSVKVDGKEVKYTITDTRMQVDLPKELKSNGGSVKVKIDYAFVSPEDGADRMGYLKTKRMARFIQWHSGIRVLRYMMISKDGIQFRI